MISLPSMKPQLPLGERRVPLWFPPVVFLFGGLLASAGFATVARIFHSSTDVLHRPWWLQIVALVFLWAALLAGTWWAHREYGPLFEPGFFRVRFFQAPRSDGVYLLVGVALQLVVGILYYPFHAKSASQPVHEVLGNATGWRVAIVMLAVGVGAPIVEEIFFRGLLLRTLQTVPSERFRTAVSGWLPVLVSGVLFAAAHVQGVQFFGLALTGIVLAWIRMREQRLAPSVVTHAGFNLIALVTAYFVAVGS